MSEEFRIDGTEIPDKKIESISFLDVNIEYRRKCYGENVMPVTIKFEDNTQYETLARKWIIQRKK